MPKNTYHYKRIHRKPGAKAPAIRIDKERFEVFINEEMVHLPALLFDIFTMICEADGKVVSRVDVIKKLYNLPQHTAKEIKTRTVDQGMCRLRKMLGEIPLIQTVQGRGYKLIRY
jgi:DNA-binding response OmpR family regulator